MEENVLFNLGNLVASSKDEKELIRMAQIASGKKIKDVSPATLPDGFLIIKVPDSEEFQLINVQKS
ncbi:MAG TPA: hypothetical protein K8U99_00530 [Enterococcus cecorum]|nr:hypothetical protein [Enterococcus cecorum]